MRLIDASSTYAVDMQAHAASLEELLTNPTKEQATSGPSGVSLMTRGPQEAWLIASVAPRLT